MATGDAAAAAGMDILDPLIADLRDGATEINKTRDYLAAHQTSGTHPASAITSGTLAAARIPNLDGSKITTGTVPAARIADLDAAKITTGTLGSARIPTLPASQITTGEFSTARIPNLPASLITTGELSTGRIPDLPASKITSGEFSTARIPNLPASQITSGNISRPVVTTGNGTFNAAWNNDVGAVTRRAMWMDSNGTLGHTSSSKRYKKAIRRAETDPLAILSIEAKYYNPRGKGWQKEQDHEPTYIGFIAEDLAEAGLWEFIWFDEQGRPDGIHYELLGIAAIHAAQHLHQRLNDLETRLNKLEGKAD